MDIFELQGAKADMYSYSPDNIHVPFPLQTHSLIPSEYIFILQTMYSCAKLIKSKSRNAPDPLCNTAMEWFKNQKTLQDWQMFYHF